MLICRLAHCVLRIVDDRLTPPALGEPDCRDGFPGYLQQCSWVRMRGESEMYVAREVVVENDPEKLEEALAVYRSRVDELEKVGCVASYLLRDRSEARLTWLSVWEERSADARGEQTQKRVDIARQVAEVLGGVRQTVPELEVLERYP